ncbi:MAG: glucose-6-phosphate isomerase [Phycisphaerae bacterium]
MTPEQLWETYNTLRCRIDALGLEVDISRVRFDEGWLTTCADRMGQAMSAMDMLEQGGKANASENRMVGHYWLRDPSIAPDHTIAADIRSCIAAVQAFAQRVHAGEITPEKGDGFDIVLIIGIGGSALGPQLLADALSTNEDIMLIRFLDNTDPDGIDRVLDELDENLSATLTVVVSKSGGTRETRNAMIEVAARYKQAGLDFGRHAVAVTGPGSTLDRQAESEHWLARFPLWDWVGGRTSITAAVGLLPAALMGFDLDAFLAGAAECDRATRTKDVAANPAALLALMWLDAAANRGKRNLVVLPYRDRLGLLGRYLQQLIMESLGKRLDRDGGCVHQGFTVYGNKGSTDQHALVQQLRDGPNDFLALMIGVLRDRGSTSIPVDQDVTSGDYLHAYLYATRDALYEQERDSVVVTLDEFDAKSLGAIIALFERAVGLYAELVNVNAYDQPGVEAGKQSAEAMLALQRRVLARVREAGRAMNPEEIAAALGASDAVEQVHRILRHAAANPDHGICGADGQGTFAASSRADGP